MNPVALLILAAMPAAAKPIDLHQDERRMSWVVSSKPIQKLPFLLRDGQFDQLGPEEKARLAKEHLEALHTGLSSQDLWNTIEVLGALHERRALVRLHSIMLGRGRPAWLAARALYRIGDPQSLPFFVQATSHSITNTRAVASFALHKMTGQHFRTPEEWQRWWAAQPQAQQPTGPPSAALAKKLEGRLTLKPPYPRVDKGPPPKSLTVEQAIASLLRQVGVDALFFDKDVDYVRVNYVTPKIEDCPCDVALYDMLATQGVTYRIKGESVVVVAED